jgi:hypothetical protein
MPDERRHESADLEDYQTLDSYDTLDGPPGDDPLDRGVVTPDRWSAAMKFGSSAEEQQDGESLDELLAEEEPDETDDVNDEEPGGVGWDENATEREIGRMVRDPTADPRSGRLIADDEAPFLPGDPDLVAYDAGIDGGGATAEEAAIHVIGQDDDDADADAGT